MKQFITVALLMSSFAINADTENTCTMPNQLEIGEEVYQNTYVNNTRTYKLGTVVRQRSNKNYVLRNDYQDLNQYSTNYSFSQTYLKRGCLSNSNNKSLRFRVKDNAYILVKNGYNISYKKVEIVGISPVNANLIARDYSDEIFKSNENSSEEERIYDHNRNVRDVFSVNLCSTDTDDGSKICPNDIAISLTHAKDVKVLAVGNKQVVVSLEGSKFVMNTINLINIDDNNESEL